MLILKQKHLEEYKIMICLQNIKSYLYQATLLVEHLSSANVQMLASRAAWSRPLILTMHEGGITLWIIMQLWVRWIL